jgi:hypothetical protein
MAAIAKLLYRRFPDTTSFDVDILKAIALFCGIGLMLSLIVASYGLDLSPGFF